MLKDPIAVIIIAVIAVAAITMVVVNRKGALKKAALYLVSVAEVTWGSQTGQIKFSQVYAELTAMYPILTLLLPESTIRDMIEEALSILKAELQSGAKLEV